VYRFLGSLEKLRKVNIGFMSVRLAAWNNSAPNRRILIKFDFENFSENSQENSSFTKTRQD